MKFSYLLVLICSTHLGAAAAPAGVRGTVESPRRCSDKVMVWLSLDKEHFKERILLMHTEVPVGGTFQFYLKPGAYQLRASDEKGCEFSRRVTVTKGILRVPVKLEWK